MWGHTKFNRPFRYYKRKDTYWQLEGWFSLKNTKTGKLMKGKGFSKTFKNLHDKRLHHPEAKNHALSIIGGTNWVIVSSHYSVIRWHKIKKRKKAKRR